MGGGELWLSSRPFSPLPASRGEKIYSSSVGGEKRSSQQHLETHEAEAWLAVTVANLKVVKVLAGSRRERVMDSCIPLTGQGVKTL